VKKKLKINISGSHLSCLFRKVVLVAQESVRARLFEQEIHDIENFRGKEFYSKGCFPRKIQQEFALGRNKPTPKIL